MREFVLRLGRPGDAEPSVETGSNSCELVGASVEDGAGVLRFRHADPDLAIELRVTAASHVSKQLSITNTGVNPVVLFDIVLDRFRLPEGIALSRGGRGKPAFIGDFAFAGIEFPESHSVVEEGVLSLGYYPAVTLEPGETHVSETAALRFTPNGVEEGFLDHIRALKPPKPRRFAGYYSTRGAHEHEGPSTRVLAEQAEHVIDLRTNWRIPIEYFIVDCDDASPSCLDDEERFPDGSFDRIAEKLAASGIRLGLRTKVESADTLCDLVRQRNIKLLILTASGGEEGLPDKYTGYQAAVSTLELISALKSAVPDLVIELSGFANSPWWLGRADMVVGASDDLADEPAPSLRDSQIVQTDLEHQLFEMDEGTCINYSDCSFWSGKQLWKKSAIMSLCRSGRLYISGELHLLDEKDRLFLQRMVQVRNAYSKSIGAVQRVFGDPAEGQVYGYGSVVDGRGLVAVFNPSWESRLLNVRAQDLHCDPAVRNVCIQLFPRTEAWAMLPRGSFHLHMHPWEVRWFEVGPSQEHVELLESKSRRAENYPIPVSHVLPVDNVEQEITRELDCIRFGSGCMQRCRPLIPRAWEAFPLFIGLKGLEGRLYVNNHPSDIRDDADFTLLYPWTPEYGRLQFGRENLLYLATREADKVPQSDLLLRPLPYFSSSACREDWPHAGDCCMVVIIRYLKDGKPYRPSMYPETAQCAVWLDGTWMEPYRVPPLVPRIRSGFSWAAFMLDLEGDWECVRILVPEFADCDYDVKFFLTDRLKAAAYARGE